MVLVAKSFLASWRRTRSELVASILEPCLNGMSESTRHEETSRTCDHLFSERRIQATYGKTATQLKSESTRSKVLQLIPFRRLVSPAKTFRSARCPAYHHFTVSADLSIRCPAYHHFTVAAVSTDGQRKVIRKGRPVSVRPYRTGRSAATEHAWPFAGWADGANRVSRFGLDWIGCRWAGRWRPADRLLGDGGWNLERTTCAAQVAVRQAGPPLCMLSPGRLLVSRMDKEGCLFLFQTMIWSYGVVRQIGAGS